MTVKPAPALPPPSFDAHGGPRCSGLHLSVVELQVSKKTMKEWDGDGGEGGGSDG